MFDIFRKKSKKERKRDQLRRNQEQGRAAEDQYRVMAPIEGWELERTGKGSDFRRRKRDLLTGKVIRSELVDVKSGDAKRSKLQKMMGAKVVREETGPFWESDSSFDLFGSSPSRKRKKKNSDPFDFGDIGF